MHIQIADIFNVINVLKPQWCILDRVHKKRELPTDERCPYTRPSMNDIPHYFSQTLSNPAFLIPEDSIDVLPGYGETGAAAGDEQESDRAARARRRAAARSRIEEEMEEEDEDEENDNSDGHNRRRGKNCLFILKCGTITFTNSNPLLCLKKQHKKLHFICKWLWGEM